MPSATELPRTILGPLQTPYSLPASCAIAVQQCSTCSLAYQGQTCFSTGSSSDPYYKTAFGVADNTDCWPPRASFVSTPAAPLAGWGFYSPAIACPAGMTSACSATAGGPSGWPVQYGLLPQETAVGCCPSGFTCANDGYAQTCEQVLTQSNFQAVTCESGTSGGFTFLTVPVTVQASATALTISQYSVHAPLIQINWQASDRTTATSGLISSTATSAGFPTAFTATPTPTASIPSGLSSGTKAGMGIGVALGDLAVLAVAFFISKRRQNLYAATRQYTPADSQYELQAGKKGSYAMSELPSGTQVSELPPEERRAQTRQVYEMGS